MYNLQITKHTEKQLFYYKVTLEYRVRLSTFAINLFVPHCMVWIKI